ncbi:hypothetical protein AB0D71_20000 [Streptomyces avermitilis]|uniref:hypothetical protein n=1 Tax=Streptomyces avermitilis TaxID=33903 RepID=UPI0033FC7846
MASSNERARDGWSFPEIGEPFLVVRGERRDLFAVAGTHVHGSTTPTAVYSTTTLTRRALMRSRFPVHAMAFPPRLPLLAVGTGQYDGGYFFECELLLLHLKTGTVTSLIEHDFGRQVLGLEGLDEQSLRVFMAPPDDWQDEAAHTDGHIAVVHRTDWTAVPAASLNSQDLAGPRTSAPRADTPEAVQRAAAAIRSILGSRPGARLEGL